MSRLSSVRFYRLYPDAVPPQRASDGAVGYDAYAHHAYADPERKQISKLPQTILPGEYMLFGTGIATAFPFPFEAQVRPRSGLANKLRVELGNAPGTVDPDYRGDIGILLTNRGTQPFVVKKGDRIAQLVFSLVEIPDLVEAKNMEELDWTNRGEGGFGHTGMRGAGLGTRLYKQAILRTDRILMRVAIAESEFSECARGCDLDEEGHPSRDRHGFLVGQQRRFGCVIARGKRVIATGYNTPGPWSKCTIEGCRRDREKIPSGTRLEECDAVHAEMMAFLTASENGIAIKGATMYTNGEPCLVCTKLIAFAGLEALVVLKGGYSSGAGLRIVERAGIQVREITLPRRKK